MTGALTTYRRCLVLAGGGGRLGVHLGIHQAAGEAGLAPDVVLGTCGGALVAALVHAEPDPARQVAWLASEAMHAVFAGIRPRHAGNAPLPGAIRRVLDPRLAPRVPDLHGDALFEETVAWPELGWRAAGDTPDAVLLGGRLLPDATDVGAARRGRPLLEVVAIGPARATSQLDGCPAALAQPPHVGSAIAPTVATRSAPAIDLMDAVRISLTDMIYLPPLAHDGHHWLGGAVDLLPMELAARLAPECIADHRDPISPWTLGAAWRSVLGVHARRRQAQAEAMPATLRVDLRGLQRTVPQSILPRRPARVRGRWMMQPTPWDAVTYRRIIEAQVAEGRRRFHEALAGAPRRGGA